MIALPKYQPLQWVIIEGESAFAQIINATEGSEGGWTYHVSTDGVEMQHIEEDEIEAFQENDKWLKKSVVTTKSVYS